VKIIYKTGDLMQARERFILHGCNAQGRMGSGVAKLIRDRYPTAYADYRSAYDDCGLSLGQVIWSINDPHVIINAITQEFYGYDAHQGAVYVSYEGLGTAIDQINQTALKSRKDASIAASIGGIVTEVAMPLVGAGLAGGSWDIIEQIIEGLSLDFQPVVYLFDGKIPGRS
jgi:O-acetyl-ADP-ribose deacetylase (regulator of RNase III)